MKKATKNKIKLHAFRTINILLGVIPLDKKKVLFLSDQREVLGGNLECLYNYIENKDYKRVLILKSDTFHKRNFKDKIKLIYNLSTSKYIILDDWTKSVCMMRRRKHQEIVQLWHGAGAFKTFGFSRMDRSKKFNKYSMHRNYTKAIVTSDKIRWCFAEGFGMSEENVQATGFPRTDCLLDKAYLKQKTEEFYKEYPELKNKKIVLFAPTYRGVNLKKAYYDFDKLDLEKLQKKLGKDYAFIIKWHPGLYDKIKLGKLNFDISKYKGFAYDFSDNRDINDLLIITDVLITDYSSVIFDYYLLDKPVVYYTYDLDDYKKERGLYYEFEDYVYGSVAYNMDELIEAIKKPAMDKEQRRVFNEKFMEACDGKSTEKTYKYIFEEK